MDNRPFAVYQLAQGLDIDALIDRLGKGITGKESHQSLWRAASAPSTTSTPTDIVRYHQATASDQSLNQNLLVIADNSDLPAQGLLIINLNFHQTIDALRQKVYFASDFVPSVNVANTSWSETLANASLPLYPRRKFAVFADKGFHPRYLMKDVLEKMNGGVGGRRAGTGTIFSEWGNPPEEAGGDRNKLARWWNENAIEREWDTGGFAIVTKDAWDKGQVVCSSQEDREEDAKETLIDAESVGELLVWLYVGFTTLDELQNVHEDTEGGIQDFLRKRGRD